MNNAEILRQMEDCLVFASDKIQCAIAEATESSEASIAIDLVSALARIEYCRGTLHFWRERSVENVDFESQQETTNHAAGTDSPHTKYED